MESACEQLIGGAPPTKSVAPAPSSAEPAEAHPPSLKLRRIPFSHSSPDWSRGRSAKAGKISLVADGENPDVLLCPIDFTRKSKRVSLHLSPSCIPGLGDILVVKANQQLRFERAGDSLKKIERRCALVCS